jgi:hypothetical protein
MHLSVTRAIERIGSAVVNDVIAAGEVFGLTLHS